MRRAGVVRALAALACMAFTAMVLHALTSLPAPRTEVLAAVAGAIQESRIEHPVTAVLLQFRVWDTLLEVAVLLLAVVGVVQLGRRVDHAGAGPRFAVELPLAWLVRFVVPMLVLAAGHVLLLGAYAPGGAFQAGALLAAATVLLILGGHAPLRSLDDATLRLSWICGLVAFLGIGLSTLVSGDILFELRAPSAGLLILGLEAAVSVAIGAALASLFVAARAAGESA